MEIVENNNKVVVKFGELKAGDVFIASSKIPMMKTETRNNAITLNNGQYLFFNDCDEVVLKKAKLVIDN